jgi:hypothetical protein
VVNHVPVKVRFVAEELFDPTAPITNSADFDEALKGLLLKSHQVRAGSLRRTGCAGRCLALSAGAGAPLSLVGNSAEHHPHARELYAWEFQHGRQFTVPTLQALTSCTDFRRSRAVSPQRRTAEPEGDKRAFDA